MEQALSNKNYIKLISNIVIEGEKFLSPIKDLEDPYDFYKVYENVIKLYDNYFKTKICDNTISLSEKFDIVIHATNHVKIDNYRNKFIEKICNISFDDPGSKLMCEIKNDAYVITFVTIFCYNQEQFELPYNLLNHLNENINIVSTKQYDDVICNIKVILDFLTATNLEDPYCATPESEYGENLDMEILDYSIKKPIISKTYKIVNNILNKLQKN